MAKKYTDYYGLLEVSHEATMDEIRSNYYIMAKKYHPDINPNGGGLFREINLAYETLSNPIKRKEYDLANGIISDKILEKFKHEVYTHDELTIEFINDLEVTYENLKYKYNTDKELINNIYTKLLPRSKGNKKRIIEYVNQKRKEENTLNEMIDGDEIFPFDWFNDNIYYAEAKRQPIFEILYNFNKYRFENAISAIWNRNAIAIFGVFFVYLLSIPVILRNKLFKKYLPSRKKYLTRYKARWLNYFINLQVKNKLIQTIYFTISLFLISISKVIYNILYTMYWIFRNVLVYFLLPIAYIFKIFFLIGFGWLFGLKLNFKYWKF